MNFDKYTIKSKEALQKATEIAAGSQQQVIEPGHLLQALLLSDENVFSFLLKKLSINQQHIEDQLEKIIDGYPKVSGGEPYLSNDAMIAMQLAEKELKTFGDDFIAVEHLLLGILGGTDKVASLMKSVGFVKDDLVAAIKELRGGNTVNDPNADR